jgi:hypothetical protein
MQPLNLPAFAYKIQASKAGYEIFDVVRKKYVNLTPEEWVRQHFLHYLIGHLAYPKALIRLEQSVRYNRLRHRPDMVAYDRAARPLMLVECKASCININHEAWGQIARYNTYLNAQLLVITNGIEHFCWQLDYVQGTHTLLKEIPPFDSLAVS